MKLVGGEKKSNDEYSAYSAELQDNAPNFREAEKLQKHEDEKNPVCAVLELLVLLCR